MGFQVGPIVGVASAVTAALKEAAASPTNSLHPTDVPKIAPKVSETVNQVVEQQVKPIVDVLTNQEPWYKSPQAITAILSLIGTLLGLFGVVFDAEAQKQALTLIMTATALVSGVLVFWNRYIRPSKLAQKLGLSRV